MKNTHTKSQIINWVKKITGKKLNPNYFDYAKKKRCLLVLYFCAKKTFYPFYMEQYLFKLYYAGNDKFEIIGENVSGKGILS